MKHLKILVLALVGLLSLTLGIWHLWKTATQTQQLHLVLQPDAASGKDAVLWSYQPDTRYPNHPQLLANAWTFNNEPSVMRSLFAFDLSPLQGNVQVEKAILTLHHHVANKNQGHIGSNRALIRRVTEPWDEQLVSWALQPATTPHNQVALPLSQQPDQDYTIDLTPLIRDALADPKQSFGFMLQLDDETHYRSLVFASSDVAQLSLRPSLSITYTTRR